MSDSTRAQGTDDEELLFRGLKVLDVASWIAAPVATVMLADFGADVIKVEMPETGAGYRHYAGLSATPTSPHNYTWIVDGRNKRSLTLNLKTADGMAILHRLIAECDVYVTNHPFPLRDALKLNYEDIRPLNERMIYASLTAYGETGPDREREGFDLVAYWARSGLMDPMRVGDAPPCPAMPGMGDHPTAVALYASIVTALLRRERTGKGSHVHTSLLANGVWSNACLAQAKLVEADFSTFRNAERPPFNGAILRCADGGWIQFAMVRTDAEVHALLHAIGMGELARDPRYAALEARMENSRALIGAVAPRIAERSRDEWMATFRNAGVPVVPVQTMNDLPGDPQVELNGIFRAPSEDVGSARVVAAPVFVDGMPRTGITRGPEIGEHSVEILAELGYDDAEIGRLLAEGIV